MKPGEPSNTRAFLLHKALSELEEYIDSLEIYERLLELAQDWKGPADLYKDAHRVPGCQNATWLSSRWTGDELVLQADSEARLIRGIMAFLVPHFHGASRDELAAIDLGSLERSVIFQRLSPSRANGLQTLLDTFRRLQDEALEGQ